MPISNEQVKYIAKLAKLNLTPNETEKYTSDLAVIVDYFEQLKNVDTENIEIQNQSSKEGNIFREDKIISSLEQEKALKNAPETDGEFFLVPKVIG
ncbi:MAG: Asp-tRNA(Asn)/Glu-tRNA(Gln) amidotransferase subunit GatC [Candidatus Zixiibacteriota bacterium]